MEAVNDAGINIRHRFGFVLDGVLSPPSHLPDSMDIDTGRRNQDYCHYREVTSAVSLNLDFTLDV